MPDALDLPKVWHGNDAVTNDRASIAVSSSEISPAPLNPAAKESPVIPGSPIWGQILESVSLGMAVLEAREGHTLWTNTALRRLLLSGVGMSDVLQWQPYEYLPNLDLEVWNTVLQRVAGNAGGEAGSDFGRLQFVHHATRNIAYWEWNLQRLQGPALDTPCLLLTVHNVSDVVMNERQLATAVRASQQAKREAEALGNLAQRVNRSLTRSDLLRTIVQEAAKYFETHHAAVLLFTPGTQELQVGGGIGLNAPCDTSNSIVGVDAATPLLSCLNCEYGRR